MEQFQSSSLDWEVKLSEELAGGPTESISINKVFRLYSVYKITLHCNQAYILGSFKLSLVLVPYSAVHVQKYMYQDHRAV